MRATEIESQVPTGPPGSGFSVPIEPPPEPASPESLRPAPACRPEAMCLPR
jgi:hypothetical protein